MNTEMLLSSAVIAAILSGIISFLISRRQETLQYITGERKEWREKIREIAYNLNGANYKDTLKLLTELKVRINAFGKMCQIWITLIWVSSRNADILVWMPSEFFHLFMVLPSMTVGLPTGSIQMWNMQYVAHIYCASLMG